MNQSVVIVPRKKCSISSPDFLDRAICFSGEGFEIVVIIEVDK